MRWMTILKSKLYRLGKSELLFVDKKKPQLFCNMIFWCGQAGRKLEGTTTGITTTTNCQYIDCCQTLCFDRI